MARSKSRSRSRSKHRHHRRSSRSRSPASSSESRSRSPSPSRHQNQKQLYKPDHHQSPASNKGRHSSREHSTLRRGRASPEQSNSRRRGSPLRRGNSRSPVHGDTSPARRQYSSRSPRRGQYSNRSPGRRDSRPVHRDRSRSRGRRDSSRDRHEGRQRRGSSRDRERRNSRDGHEYPRQQQLRYSRDDDRHNRSDHHQRQQHPDDVPHVHSGSRWDRPKPTDDVRNQRHAGPPASDEPPAVGSIHAGVVQSVKPFGVFVAIQGYRKHVLVHHTQVSAEVMLTRSDEDDMKVKALEFVAAPGQRAWVKILEVSPDHQHPGSGFRVHGSMRVVDQQTGEDLDPTGQLSAAAVARGGQGGRERLSDDAPDVGSCHRAEVKRIEAYGVFVALQGYRKYGLVHASQVANYLEFSAEDNESDRKKALSDVVDLGQDVWVKVVEVGEDERGRGPKIGCSMKLVDQTDGTDLDPQNLRYRPRGESGQGGGGHKAPIGASAGEVKAGTVDWGYLATRPDAFGSTGYELLGDEPDGPPPGAGPGRPRQQQQQQQPMPPVGRGRGAVLPAWMSQGPAAPGASAAQEQQQQLSRVDTGGEAANLTLEEALRIVQAAAGKKRHKDKHKKHKKHKKSSKSKKSHKSSQDRRRHSSGSDSSSENSDRSR